MIVTYKDALSGSMSRSNLNISIHSVDIITYFFVVHEYCILEMTYRAVQSISMSRSNVDISVHFVDIITYFCVAH